MGWPQEDNEKRERARVAKELTRQDFWKAAYVASLCHSGDNSFAVTQADNALSSFDLKFGGAP